LTALEMERKKISFGFFSFINNIFLKPFSIFFSIYFRHLGFLDGFPGFVFSLYSGLHHAFAYMKLWELYKNVKD